MGSRLGQNDYSSSWIGGITISTLSLRLILLGESAHSSPVSGTEECRRYKKMMVLFLGLFELLMEGLGNMSLC